MVRQLLNTYPYTDFDPYYTYVNTTISKLMNWEIISESDMKWSIKSMKQIIETRIVNILVERNYIDKLIYMIDSENFPI